MTDSAGGPPVADEMVVAIRLDAAVLQAFYRGQVVDVQAQAEDGRRVRLPLRLLRPYFSHAGLSGRFRLQFDASGRALQISPC